MRICKRKLRSSKNKLVKSLKAIPPLCLFFPRINSPNASNAADIFVNNRKQSAHAINSFRFLRLFRSFDSSSNHRPQTSNSCFYSCRRHKTTIRTKQLVEILHSIHPIHLLNSRISISNTESTNCSTLLLSPLLCNPLLCRVVSSRALTLCTYCIYRMYRM